MFYLLIFGLINGYVSTSRMNGVEWQPCYPTNNCKDGGMKL